jgi:hypothetical protein
MEMLRDFGAPIVTLPKSRLALVKVNEPEPGVVGEMGGGVAGVEPPPPPQAVKARMRMIQQQ